MRRLFILSALLSTAAAAQALAAQTAPASPAWNPAAEYITAG